MRASFLALVTIVGMFFGSARGDVSEIIPASNPNIITPDMRFHHFGHEEGLTSPQLTAVARDSRGFLWVATYNGLFRFDGYRFRHFVHEPGNINSLSGNRLRSLTIDRYDRVWVGTESNGVTVYDPIQHKFTHFGNDPSEADTYFAGQTLLIKELSDSSMAFMVFGDGVARLLPDMETIVRYRSDPTDPESISSNHCLAADVDIAGDLWIACFGGTVQRYQSSTETFETLESIIGTDLDVPLGRVSVLSFLKNNDLWMGTDGVGVAVLEAGVTTTDYFHPETPPFSLLPGFVTKITEDELGNLWIGYRDSGVDIIDQKRETSRHLAHETNKSSSLSSDNTFAITQDDEGLVWVPTYGAGLNVTNVRNSNISIYESTSTAPGPFASNANIRLLTELLDGRMLVASRDNRPALFHREGDAFVLDQTLDLTPGDERPFWIVDALQSQNGDIWLPTVGRGLFVYDLQTNSANLLPGTEGWNLVAIFEDISGRIWISEFSRGVFLVDPSTKQLIPFSSETSDAVSLGMGLVQGFKQTTDKAIWINSRSGVFRYLPEQRILSKIISLDETTGQDRLQGSRGILQDSKGRVWVAGDQIAYTLEPFASNPEFIFPFEQTAFKATAAVTVTEDDRGRLWFSVEQGLLSFDPASGSSVLVEESMGAPTNVPEGGALKLRDGNIAFASSRHLTLVSPAIFEQISHVKAPEITRLVVGGKEVMGKFSSLSDGTAVQQGAYVTVSPEAQDFTVEYASLTPIAAQSYTYAHKLEGFNRDWISTDASRRSATYTNLPPGVYRLLMRAFDSNGRTSRDPSELVIRVLPAFHQTTWFRLLVAAVIVLILYAAYHTRIAVMEANQRKLELQVQERTAEIEAQRAELADRNVKIEHTMSELKETQGKLIQSEKLAALGGVVAGVAHEVNTPIGLVVSGASQIEDEVSKIRTKVDENKITKSELQRFLAVSGDLGHLTLKNAQKAAELIKSFKRISADQTSQQIAEFELMEYLKDLVASLKPMLVETGHKVIVKGDPVLTIKSNPGTLGQVVTNLVINAVAHAYSEGETGTITITAVREGEGVSLSVGDDGCGISDDNRERVFEPFFTTNRGKGNTGLGLHIVHNMVVGALEGTVELGETPEKGALFTVHIPDLKGHTS